MNITAWRQTKNDDKSVVCRIQVSYKDGRKIKPIINVLKGWRECAEGFSPVSKETILIFQMAFKNDVKWKSFLRKFPYRIVERTPTDKERVYNAKKVI